MSLPSLPPSLPWSSPSPPSPPAPPWKPPLPPGDPPPPSPPSYEAGTLVVGVVLSFIGAIMLGLAMPLQRYALTYPEARVPLCGGCIVSKNVAWVLSLCVYGAANGLNASAQQMAPLSLLSSVFTLMIVFNAIFARIILKEELTRPKLLGGGTILLGIVIAVTGFPRSVQTIFDAEDVEDLLKDPGGVTFQVVLFGSVFASVVGICMYEQRYPPLVEHPDESKGVELASSGGDGSRRPDARGSAAMVGPPPSPPPSPSEGAVDVSISGTRSRPDGPADSSSAAESVAAGGRRPPPRLDRLMMFVYPGSLGLDEAINGTWLRAAISMMGRCTTGEGKGEHHGCDNPLMYIGLAIMLTSALATVWWLKVVYKRYETTIALPIEYGVVNVAMCASGLIFYQEHKYYETWQLAVTITGSVVVCLGISIFFLKESALGGGRV